jgi:C1A family cysteine protease
LFLFISTAVITFINNKFNKSNSVLEKFSRGFPPIKKFSFRFYYRAVTPLKPLKSPLKIFKPLELPEIFIYKPKYFSSVGDQGRCGGCWAFVICQMLSDDITIKIIKFGKNLNVQQLLSCYPGDGCDGAAPEDALLWMLEDNFKLEIKNEYLQVKSECQLSETGITVENNSIKSLCKDIERECITNPTVEEEKLLKENIKRMKTQLYKDGPFFGSLSIYQDFFNFLGDKVYTKGSDELIGGHAIEIVGWCDPGVDLRSGFKDGYWVCKNSWSKYWAPKYDFPGYFAIKMGVNECGIESRSGTANTNVEQLWEGEHIPDKLAFSTYRELLKHIIETKKIEKY